MEADKLSLDDMLIIAGKVEDWDVDYNRCVNGHIEGLKVHIDRGKKTGFQIYVLYGEWRQSATLGMYKGDDERVKEMYVEAYSKICKNNENEKQEAIDEVRKVLSNRAVKLVLED